MKKNDFFYKTVQFVLYILLTGLCLYIVLFDSRIYHLVAQDTGFRTLCILLWVTLGLSFFFIYRDFSFFSSYKRDYRELDYAVHSDPLTGLANRFSCDVMIERYMGKPLPEDFGCVMFDLKNLDHINRLHGHPEGNRLIREFSDILKASSLDLCFVGRNGGNKFLAVFEEGSEEKLDHFLTEISQKTARYNAACSGPPIVYGYGVAFHEQEQTITGMIALSNQRIDSAEHP